MTEQRLFGSLCRGIQFNTSRFGSDISNFENAKKVGNLQWTAPILRDKVANLDFFGFDKKPISVKTSEHQNKANKLESEKQEDKHLKAEKGKESKKKLKRNKNLEKSEEEISLFGSSKSKSNQKSPENHSSKEEEEYIAFRKRMGIRTYGSSIPSPLMTFEDMEVDASIKQVLLKNIENSLYKEPTPIQMQAIPVLLDGRDLLAAAPTGSGKTAAFLLPIFARLKSSCEKSIKKKGKVRSIILAPTRELAHQIFLDSIRLSEGKKFRILLLNKSIAHREEGKTLLSFQDLIISTPSRILNALKKEELDLNSVEMLCLDEADRLFELGFVEQIDEILLACSNPHIQRMMFSATIMQGVEELAQSVLRDPIKVIIGIKNSGAETISQRLVFVGREEGKLLEMRQIIQKGLKPPVLIFLQSKDRAKALYNELVYDNINVDVIHSDRTKEQRDQTIKNFRIGETWVLICTDLMARGIDFKGVNIVINYDFPQSPVSYIHRIGRTGRAGHQGEAITFFTEADMEYVRAIANVIKLSGGEVPEWLLNLKKSKTKEKRKLKLAPPKRKRISTISGYDLQKHHKKRMLKETKNQSSKVNTSETTSKTT